MRTTILLSTVAITALVGLACNKNAAPPGKTSPKASSTTPSGKVPAGQMPMKMVGNTGGGLSGAVTETMDAASYTYVKLKTSKGEVWAAVPKAKVTVGQKVTVVGAQMMSNFKSNTLKRTFASIYFGRLGKPGQVPPKGAVHGAGGPAAKKVAAAHGKPKGKKQNVGTIAKAGYTIADVFSQRAKLAKKKVTVRGKVTKFNANIMGKNWLHLQDGTGSEADKSFDLTVTTKGAAKVGDVVLVEGVLSVGKDFGAGYKYAAIVEDAKLSK